MDMLAFLAVKRDGGEHDGEALRAFARAVAAEGLPDYQVAAWLMAAFLNGLSDVEAAELTRAMADTGDALDLSDLPHTVDKHSTGGVGDKTTLVLAPLLAAAGATVAKMSGRGLGHTGGTIDKLESIHGFRAALDEASFLRQAREVGVVVTGQSQELAPADGRLYALRDLTGTVASPPLIASSVMSKKLAGGARSLVLDVKVGRGAFVATVPEARALGATMRAIGEHAGRNVRVVLSDMEQPLGRTVGNALEVREALDALRGAGPPDLRALVLTLAERVLEADGLATPRAQLEALLDGGEALARFERWMRAQGGEPDHPESLALAPGECVFDAPSAGTVGALDALLVGDAVKRLGGGRRLKGAAIDLGVGVTLHAKVGDRVEAGTPLATLHHRDGHGLEDAQARLREAFTLDAEAAPRPLILDAGA